jgi:phthiocerol/phenolphthiocerol synthesis type-I polyketide synthase D
MAVIRTEAELLRWLRDNVADLLEIDANEIDPERPLTELGISSRDAVGLVGELEDYLDRDLDATLVWQTPTIAALARSLAGDGADAPTPAAAAELPAPGGGTLPVVGAAEPSAAAPADDPVVVVGLGCRLPGGSTGPAAFWDLLANGRDAVTEVPDGRWDDFTAPSAAAQDAAGRTNRTGGYLGDVSLFDAEFFGITPREAELMDPQQRILLEVTVEALEHAGISIESLRGSDTGVFVGMSTNEYSHLTTADLAGIDAWTSTGSAFSIAANRLSYLFDLRGPSMTLDTACSSSLVAMHQARLSMVAGEIDTAIVAGVNLLLSPAVTMTFDQAGALAATGGPKPFSSDADGIARAEGCGVVVLKKLSKATADGDRVLAVLRGSAVNQDGRSNGLTAPNPLAQEALLRSAYAAAGLVPEQVDYVEAHGTGTSLGDPIEAGALGAALGRNRDPRKPLLLGSVKSNLGHLESAAGIAGVIKVVLGLTHDRIPASLKYAGPNPHIRFDDWRLLVVAQERDWPRYGGTAVAGVSGFGFGGTNAHVILEEFVSAGDTPPVENPDEPVALPLSARSEARVRALAGALADQLTSSPAVNVREVAHTLARRRGRGPSAAVVAARGREALTDALRRFAAEQEQPKTQTVVAPVPATGPVGQHTPGTLDAVWVFSGWGQQWAGMGRRLLTDEPVFAASIDELEPLVQAEAGFSLRAALEGRSPVEGVAATQIVLFSIQISLAALWRSLGLRPAAVIGHSMGEVAAAVVAGGLDLADGVRVITVRSRLLERFEKAGAGAMAVVDLDARELEGLAGRFPSVAVCVYGSPNQLTVGSPDAAQLAELCRYVEGLGRNAWPLKVRGAAHSPSVEPILPELAAGVAGITPRTPSVPMYSTANPDPRTPPAFDADYWVANARRPVRFSQAVVAAVEDGHAAFIEISAHPVALNALRQSVSSHVGSGLLALPSLRRDADDTVTFRAHALAAQLAGLRVDPARVVPVAAQTDLPLPAWQHRSHWVESTISQVPDVAVDRHPLLGVHVELPEGGRHLWRADAGTAVLPWLNDHQVYDVPVLPVAAYAEMALAAAREILAPDAAPSAVVLENLQLLEMMSLGEHTDVTTSVTLLDGGAAQVDIHARPPGSSSSTPMSRHASAVVRRTVPPNADLVIDVAAAEEGRPVDLYAVLAAAGHEYGPSFLGVSEARLSSSGVATARVGLPDGVPRHAGYTVHPVLLDICLQTIVVSALSLVDDVQEAAGQFYLPVGVGSVRVLGDPGRGGLAMARIQALDDGSELVGGVRVVDDAGNPLLEVQDVKLRRIGSDEIAVPLPDLLFSAAWEESGLPSGSRRASWLLLDATDGDGRPLAAALEEAGHRVIVEHADRLGSIDLRAGLDDDSARPAAGVLLLTPGLPADAGSVGGALGARAAYQLGEVVNRLADDLAGTGLDLVVVTASGAAVLEGEPGRPSLSSLRGQVRVLARVPQAPPIALIDLDGDPAGLVAELSAPPSQDDEVAWRNGTRLVRRVRRTPLAELGDPFAARPGGYVLTDALDGLDGAGLRIARNLATRLARAGEPSRLVLGSATATAEEADRAVNTLAGLGVPVEVVLGDPADAETVKRMISAATAGDRPLRGLIQAPAGRPVQNDEDSRAAVAAAWHLHDLSTRSDLDVFCLRSSATALFGAPADLDAAALYAARLDATVGAWIDGLVGWRRAQGLPATSVQWGDLEVLGAAPAADAFTLLGPAHPQLGVVRMPAVELARVAGELPYFSELAEPEPEADEAWPGPDRLRSMAPAAARQKLADRLRARIAWVMGHRPEDIEMEVPLSSLGVDSLVAMRAKNALETDVGISLPVRLLLQGASLADLEAYLAGELGIDVAPAPVAGPVVPATDVEARDGTERWLSSVWEQVTGTAPSGVTAPLPSLGSADQAGTVADLILARLADEPAAAGRTLPTRPALVSAASIEAQAEIVRDLIENVGDSVVRLLAAGDRGVRPLFVFHPAGGTTSVYYPMVSQIDSSIPVYGFERLDGLTGIDDKVDRYLAEIRRIQPDGPYRLGGWSFGGALGYRTAQRLREQGSEVELLFLIDTILVRPDEQDEQDMLAGRFERFIEYLENTYDLDLDIDVRGLVDLPEPEQVTTLMRLVQEAGANLSPALMEHQRTSYEDARIAEKFQPTGYGDGRVVLYRSTDRGLTTSIDPRYARTEDSLGWDVYCNDLEVVRIPGNHTSMIDRPQVDTMAQHLSTALQEVARHV